jgi:GLPGLI family protein
MARITAKSIVLLSTVFFLFLSLSANAQIGQRIKERIKQNTERKIEDKVVNKAGEKTDQALDSLFKKRKRPGRTTTKQESPDGGNEESGSSQSKSASQGSTTPQSSGFDFAGLMNAKYESSYTMDIEMKIEMKSQEKPKKKVETVYMDMYYGDDCYMIVFEDQEEGESAKSIMDLKNNTSVVLNDNEMSGVAISMDFMTDKLNESIEESSDSDEDVTFKKTGRTKTIAGYTCEEYIIETDDMRMEAWYTDEITVQMYQNMDEYPLFASMAAYGNQGHMQGTMLESHMVEKTGDKGTFDYLVKEVNLITTTLNMSDYTFMKM